MLTRNGLGTLVLAMVLFGAGWFLGVGDLYYLGSGLLALVMVAFVIVWLRPVSIDIVRVIEPSRVVAGTPAVVHLTLDNRGGFPTPVLELVDAVTGTAGARLLLARTGRHQSRRARYDLPTHRRGEIHVGPLEVNRSDAFGLVSRRWQLPLHAMLTVQPRPVDTGPPPRTISLDPRARPERSAPVVTGGEDFYTLRDYTPGDDLRRVHWAASAHRDDLVVRQDELAWQGRIVILVDTRSHTITLEGLDVAAEVAAGLTLASTARGDEIRLLTTGRCDTGFDNGRDHTNECLRQLALIRPENGNLATALTHATALRHRDITLIAITSLVGEEDVDQLRRLSGRTRILHLVLDQSLWQADTRRAQHNLGSFSTVLTNRSTIGEDIHEAFSRSSVDVRGRR